MGGTLPMFLQRMWIEPDYSVTVIDLRRLARFMRRVSH